MQTTLRLAAIVGMAVLASTGAWADEKVPLDKLPKAVAESVKAMFPKAEMKEAEKGTTDAKTKYEIKIKDGTSTDFRMAVKAESGEKIVFAWMTWPDRATAEASQDKIMNDPRMAYDPKKMPFDGKRMFWGGFKTIIKA